MRGQRARSRGNTSVAALLAVLLALALTACSGGDSDGGSDGGGDSLAVGSADSGGSVSSERMDAPSEDDTDGTGVLGRTQVQTRAVISTGQVQLESDDLGEVRSQIDRLLGRFGGYVGREETHNDDEGRTSSATLQLRVPSQHFDTVMASFGEFATVVDRTREAEDVTTEVIDVASRIRTQEISLERLRKFLGRATKVADMIRIESEIARREADLASLRAQQDYLSDQTSMATITVRMALPEELAEDEDPLADAGFLTGLRNGWEALTDVAVVGATALGAVLPFVGVLTLVLVPLVAWLRLGRRRRPPVAAPPPTT